MPRAAAPPPTLTLATPGAAGSLGANKAIVIDAIAPTVLSIAPVSSPTGAATMNFTITFSESVTGVAAGNLSLTTTGVSGASLGAITGSGATRTVVVNTGTGNGTIRLDLSSASPAITDAATNALTATFNSGTVLTVDKTPLSATVDLQAGI